MFNGTIIGNEETGRTECEIADQDGTAVAVVYETADGWHVEATRELASDETSAFNASVADAKQRLSRYKNRIGANVPEGLSRGGLSLWLLESDDGSWLRASSDTVDPEAQNRLRRLNERIKTDVVALARDGQQILAIRELRAETNCSLDQAKEWLKDNC